MYSLVRKSLNLQLVLITHKDCIIKLHLSFRFEGLLALGKKLVPSSPMSAEVRERMKLLSQERAAIKEAWENRNKLLKQCTDVQVMVICFYSPMLL